MMFMMFRVAGYAGTILMIAVGDIRAQAPATIDEAAKAIDLQTFPLLPGSSTKAPRRLANLDYTARSDVRGAFAFQKKTLEERGWKELPGGYLSDQSCSGTFGKDGFRLIQFSTELMSVELPAPPGYLSAAYADATKALRRRQAQAW